MTEAAVIADSAPVSEAPVGGAPINENAGGAPQPLGSQVPDQPQAKEPAKPASLDDSINKAIAKSEAKQAEVKPPAKVEPKEQPKPEPVRGEGGKFAQKEPAPAVAAQPAPKPAEQPKPSYTAEDAPARFTETAKTKWASADPEIRGEVLRMQRELTDGYQKHAEAAKRDAVMAEFHDMAKQSNKELHNVVREYVNMENALRKDPIGGLNELCTRMGFSLRDVAAHVMGQTPDQQTSQTDATVRELREQVRTLTEQIGGVTKTVEQQAHERVSADVAKFAAAHPRFDELADDIAFFMKSGRAKELPEAYELAERLNPAPAQAKTEIPAASSVAPEPPVQTDKGNKSIHGAPGSGSAPGKKRVSKSLNEALDSAFASL